MKKYIYPHKGHCPGLLKVLSAVPSTTFLILLLLGLFTNLFPNLSAQPSPKQHSQLTLEGTLTTFKVTLYGDSLQEIDRYRRTTKEGEYVAFILKTDKKLDMTQYLDKEGLENLVVYAGETKQSEFMLVPTFELAESFSGKDFATRYAHKRICVSGTLFFPMAGWHYITPVAVEFGKVEVLE